MNTLEVNSKSNSHVFRSLAAIAVVGTMLAAIGERNARADLPKVPEGFAIRLVAAVPAVQYPSQVATAPDGSLFVAEDPMDQVGPASKAINRILVFKDGKEPIVFADKLFAIFGMVWHKGSLFVMNMPHLTELRDRDGDGKADERKEIFTNLGVPAGFPNDFNDHIVSGLKIGIDGYLYVSVGDKGVPRAVGPDGRTAQIKGGGTLRCRLDGTGLEVFTTGTRNHLEPNLDDRDNLFTYDNTDDGLGWWTRVTHHIDGGFYGYPFDYHTRTDRMLPRMAEYGGGSPCGGVYYADDAWPETYRGRVYWAEWGKRAVQGFKLEPTGATFKVADKIEFVEPGKVETFRPLDLALTNDGKTMYVADWSMGGWGNKTEKLGRVYAVTYTGKLVVPPSPRGNDSDPIDAQIRALSHPAFQERFRAQTALVTVGKPALAAATAALGNSRTSAVARRHLVWVVDGIAGGTATGTATLIKALAAAEADVRAQAARALGERRVVAAIEPLVARLGDSDPVVRLQAVIALGRIGKSEAIAALLPRLADAEPFVAFSARKALKRINDWKTAAPALESSDPAVRTGMLLALNQVYDGSATRLLAQFAAAQSRSTAERKKAIEFLTEVDREAPAWDGNWWGTQPARQKPPARSIDWAETKAITGAIRKLIADPNAEIRIAAIDALAEVDPGNAAAVLRERYRLERELNVKKTLLAAFGKLADKESVDLLVSALRDKSADASLRDTALSSIEVIGSKKALSALLSLLDEKTLSPERLPGVFAALGRFNDAAATKYLLDGLKNPAAPARAAAVDALAAIARGKDDATRQKMSASIRPLLTDSAADPRNRAIAAAAALADHAAIPALIAAAETPDFRYEASMALAAMPDMAALQIYLRGLADRSGRLRQASSLAIAKLREPAAKVFDQLAARNELPPRVVPELRSIYASLAPVTLWHVLGPFPKEAMPTLDPEKPVDLKASFEGSGGQPVTWRAAKPVDDHGQINLGRIYSEGDLEAFGYAEIKSERVRKASMVVGSDDTLTVWLNGKKVYDFNDRRGYDPEQARFEIELAAGTNRLLIRCGNRGGGWQYSVAVAVPADYAFLKAPSAGATFNPDAYRTAALKGKGDPIRGRQLFSDLKGLACVKCHAVGKEGGAVGPELSSVGAKYPREELATAVLYPSAKISSGYESITLALADGRVVTGIIRGENPESIEIQDADAKTLKIKKDEIEERKRSAVSLMPNGLAQGLSAQDFVDLIAYLETLKSTKN